MNRGGRRRPRLGKSLTRPLQGTPARPEARGRRGRRRGSSGTRRLDERWSGPRLRRGFGGDLARARGGPERERPRWRGELVEVGGEEAEASRGGVSGGGGAGDLIPSSTPARGVRRGRAPVPTLVGGTGKGRERPGGNGPVRRMGQVGRPGCELGRLVQGGHFLFFLFYFVLFFPFLFWLIVWAPSEFCKI